MELPPFNIDDFNKWKQNKVYVVESDMDEAIRVEAKDFITSGIDKALTLP